MTNKELASQILEHIGGEENITFLTHCATRIRLNLKDDNKADVKVLSRLEGVITAQEIGDCRYNRSKSKCRL